MLARSLGGGRRLTFALAVYGLVVAVLATAALDRGTPDGTAWPLLGARISELQATYAEIQAGAPPLLARNDTSGGASGDAYRIVAQGDDQGLYVAAPVLADWLGLESVQEGIKVLYLGLFFVAFLIYPLIFRRLTGSVAAALASPLLLLAGIILLEYFVIDFQSDVPGDVYWILGWASVALLPPLLLLAREPKWGRWGLPLLLVIVLAAACASTLRINAGLSVAIAGAIVVLARPSWGWPARLASAVAVLAAYLVIVPAGMGAIRANGEEWASERGGLAPEVTTVHPFWHSAFIGLGYQENDRLIIYRDEVALANALAEDPDVGYLTPEYEEILRGLYFDEVTGDPVGWAWLTARKAAVMVGQTDWLIVGAAFLFAPLLLLGRRRGLLFWALGLSLPGLLLGLATGLLVIPDAQYTLAWSGTLLFLVIAGLTALIATVAEAGPLGRPSSERLRAGIDTVTARLRGARSERLIGAASVGVIVIALIGAGTGAGYYKDFRTWWTDSAGVAAIVAAAAFERSAADAAQQSSFTLGVEGPSEDLSRAVQLDGVSGYVLSDYDPFAQGADLTVEGWARRSGGGGALFGSSGAPRPTIFRIAAGTNDVQLFPANGSFATWADAWPEGDEWVHWALAVDGAGGDDMTAELFIDGVSQGVSAPGQGFGDEYGDFVAGAWSFNYREPFAGSLAGIAVYDRTLSADEIQAHADSSDYSADVLAAGPQLFWKLDETEGIEVRDLSGNDRRGVYSWDGP